MSLEQKYQDPVWRRKYCLFDMGWTGVQQWLKRTDTVLLPIGSCEQHGPHLPMGTDTYISMLVAYGAAERAEAPVAPYSWPGMSPYHMGWPGTITLRHSTFVALMSDICRSIIHHGFNRIVVVNAHRYNAEPLEQVARQLRYETGALMVIIYAHARGLPWEVATTGGLLEPSQFEPGHAGNQVTSGMLYWNPSLVDLSAAESEKPTTPDWLAGVAVKDNGTDIRVRVGPHQIGLPLDHREFCELGILGDPTKASAAIGETIYGACADYVADVVKKIQELPVNVVNREWKSRVL